VQGSLILNSSKPQASQMTHLEAWYTEPWPIAESCLWCHVCTGKNKWTVTKFQCTKYKSNSAKTYAL